MFAEYSMSQWAYARFFLVGSGKAQEVLGFSHRDQRSLEPTARRTTLGAQDHLPAEFQAGLATDHFGMDRGETPLGGKRNVPEGT